MNWNVMQLEAPSIGADTGEQLMRRVFTALNEGRVWEAIDQFDDRFSFHDHALELEFNEKKRLGEFFEKSRELFPGSVADVETISEFGDHVLAEWKLSATREQDCGGFGRRCVRVAFEGVSIARIEGGKIVEWAEYYDSAKSWRSSLGGLFTEWIEY